MLLLAWRHRGFLLGGVAAIAQNRKRFVRQAFVHYDVDVGVPLSRTGLLDSARSMALCSASSRTSSLRLWMTFSVPSLLVAACDMHVA